LSHTYKDTLKASSYSEITEVASRGNQNSSASEDSDKARLFVAKGHTSGMNGEKIIEFIASETQINPDAINDVRVYDNFSFITLPNSEAEIVLAIFNKMKRNGRSLVSKAKDKDSGGGGGRRNDGGGRRDFKGGKSYGERRSYGDRNRDSRSSDGEQPRRENRVERGRDRDRDNRGERGDRRENRVDRGDRKDRNFGEKKEFVSKKEFKKEERRTETSNEGGGEHKPKRRENKMMNYLDSDTPKHEKKQHTEKPSKKKGDSSEVDKFLKNYEDDLSW
jgi:hypothetical protein